MIARRTFSDAKWIGWHPGDLLSRWEGVREQAERFIREEVADEDIINICESAFGNSPYGFAVTVWYRERE